MRHGSRVSLLLALLQLSVSAAAQPSELSKTIEEILFAYGSVDGVTTRLVFEEDPQQAWEEVTVAANGRFASRQIDRRDEAASVSFVFLDDEFLYVDAPAGYTRTPLARLPDVRVWWASQWSAPWPMIPSWIRAIQASDDADIRVRGETLIIGSPSLELQLQFDRNHFALEQIDTYSNTTVVFTDFDLSVSPPMPLTRTLVVEISERGPDVPAMTIRSQMFYSEREFNPTELETLVRFDARARELDRYDPLSGNVYDVDGKQLYNYDEYAKEMIEKANRQASGLPPESPGWSAGTWVIAGGVSGLAIAIGLIAWRRRS